MTLVWLLLGLLVLWLAVIVVRALQFKPYPMEKTEAENFPVDEKQALERFQDMIRLKTVSYPDEKLEDPQAFADFQKLMAETYPAVTKTCPGKSWAGGECCTTGRARAVRSLPC